MTIENTKQGWAEVERKAREFEGETRNVRGVELQAVRFKTPCPHWRIRVVETGYIFESGVFQGCRPLHKVWETVETVARLTADRWAKDTLTAHL